MDNSGFNRQISEDEGSFSIASEAYSPKPVHNNTVDRVAAVDRSLASAEDTPQRLSQHKVITIKHQDTVDTDSFLEESPVSPPPAYHEAIDFESALETPHIPEQSAVVETETEMILPDLNESTDVTATATAPEMEANGLDLDVDREFTMPTYSSPITMTNGVGGSEAVVEDGDDLSLDATVNVTSTDRELEDEVSCCYLPLSQPWSDCIII